jgi:hypothetical protein
MLSSLLVAVISPLARIFTPPEAAVAEDIIPIDPPGFLKEIS